MIKRMCSELDYCPIIHSLFLWEDYTFRPIALWLTISLKEQSMFLSYWCWLGPMTCFDQWQVSSKDYAMSKQSHVSYAITSFLAPLFLPQERPDTNSLGPRKTRHMERGQRTAQLQTVCTVVQKLKNLIFYVIAVEIWGSFVTTTKQVNVIWKKNMQNELL